jgi:Rod binding domain-containing protein
VKVTLGTTTVEAPGAEPSADQSKLNEAARQFEAVLLRRMLSSLEKAMQGEAGKGTSMYGTMIVDAMADAISASGGLGMAKVLVDSVPGKKPNEGG